MTSYDHISSSNRRFPERHWRTHFMQIITNGLQTSHASDKFPFLTLWSIKPVKITLCLTENTKSFTYEDQPLSAVRDAIGVYYTIYYDNTTKHLSNLQPPYSTGFQITVRPSSVIHNVIKASAEWQCNLKVPYDSRPCTDESLWETRPTSAYTDM